MRRVLFLALGAALGLFPVHGNAQPKPLRVEDVVGMHTFSEWTPVRFSPDGNRLVYAVKDNRRIGDRPSEQFYRSGVPFNGLGADIFMVEVSSGMTTNITAGVGNNWAPVWSPNGRDVAFLSDRDGQARLWIADVTTSKIRKVSDVNVRTSEILWLPNSREVALTTVPATLTPQQFAEIATGGGPGDGIDNVEPKVPGSRVLLYRSVPHGPRSVNGTESAWNLDAWLRDLVLVNVDNGRVQEVDRGHRITKVAVSPDGAHIAMTIPKGFESGASQQIFFDLEVFSLRDRKAFNVTSNVRLLYSGASFNWSPDGSQLVYQTGGMHATGDCYVVGLKGAPPKNISNLRERTNQRGSRPLWGADGRHIYFLHEGAIWRASPDAETASLLASIPAHRIVEVIASDGETVSRADHASLVVLTYDEESKQSGFYRVNSETGETSELRQETESYFTYSREDNVSASPDGRLMAFFRQDARHAQDLWLADREFQNARRLTRLNPQFDSNPFGEARLIGWRSLSGDQLHGALLLPPDYIEGKQYPLLVCVYGGVSLSRDLVRFGPDCAAMNMQLFTTRGYAVLLPDAPQQLGTPMEDLGRTVLPGVNKVVDLGIADPQRIGLMGHSYGGYSVLSLVVQTRRFKAGVMIGGYGDIMAHYGEMRRDGSTYAISIAEQGQELMGGTPWQFRERYVENSPVFYLDRADTPLLLVHGAEDNAVASFLADEVFVGLRRLGKEAEYAKYETEPHSPQVWTYADQLDFCQRVIAWFDVHLKL